MTNDYITIGEYSIEEEFGDNDLSEYTLDSQVYPNGSSVYHKDCIILVAKMHNIEDSNIEDIFVNKMCNEYELSTIFEDNKNGQYFVKDGKNYHHIIDPRTGYPSKNASAITVIHPKGSIADAAATALMVAKSNEWFDIAKNIGLKHFLVVDNDGQLYSDTEFIERLHMTDKSITVKDIGTL